MNSVKLNKLHSLKSMDRLYSSNFAAGGSHIISDTVGVVKALKKAGARTSMMGQVDDEELSLMQRSANYILRNTFFQLTMTLIIVSHMALTVKQTDQHADKVKPFLWQEICEKFFMVMYLVDITLRLFTLRRRFFAESMNIFDLFIVSVDSIVTVVDTIAAGSVQVGPISLLRALRALRIVRVIRNFAAFRDLYLMLKGMAGAMGAIFFAFLLIVVVLTMFSIAAVEMLHPLNRELAERGHYPDCEWCEKAFGSVMNANLTFFSSILAGDSWGKLAIPLIEANYASSFLIVSVFIILEFGLLNVIVAVVVDRQAQAREEDKELQHTLKQEQAKASYKELVSLFKSMDEDGSGSLGLDEIHDSYKKHEDFRNLLRAIDVSEEDLETIFGCMDRDHGGTVDYEEFVDELHRMRTMEIRTLVYLTRQHVLEVKGMLRNLSTFIGCPLPVISSPSMDAQQCSGEQAEVVATGSAAYTGSGHVNRMGLSFKSTPSSLVSAGDLRLTTLENQFLALESRVEETARISRAVATRQPSFSDGDNEIARRSTAAINHHSSLTCAQGDDESEAVESFSISCDLDGKKCMTTKVGIHIPELSFPDEVVPELSPSSLATPGQDLQSSDGFAIVNHVSCLADKQCNTIRLGSPPENHTKAL